MGKSEVYQGFNLYGDWEHDSRDGRTFWVSVELRSQKESGRLFTEVTSISGTAIAAKYGRSLRDDLPEIEVLTFSKAKARLALGLYEYGKDYIQEITSNKLNPEIIAMNDEQVQYMILLSLYNLRKINPQKFKHQQLDVEGFCQLLGIDRKQYLLNAGLLLEDGLIEGGKFDQRTIDTGGMFITSNGVRYLDDLQEKMKYEHTTNEAESTDEIKKGYEYDVAISFAGEDRKVAEEIAVALKNKGVKVFYDDFEQDKLWGRNLIEYFQDIFEEKAKYCIMLLSENYEKKSWTNLERRVAQARAFRGKGEYILPIRIDNTKIPGLPETIGYISLANNSIDDIASLVNRKLSSMA